MPAFILIAKTGTKRPSIRLFDGFWPIEAFDCYRATVYADRQPAQGVADKAAAGNNMAVHPLEISDDLAARIEGTRLPAYPAPSLGPEETRRRAELAESLGDEIKQLVLEH